MRAFSARRLVQRECHGVKSARTERVNKPPRSTATKLLFWRNNLFCFLFGSRIKLSPFSRFASFAGYVRAFHNGSVLIKTATEPSVSLAFYPLTAPRPSRPPFFPLFRSWGKKRKMVGKEVTPLSVKMSDSLASESL